MDYQKNQKYFDSNDKHFYVGLGILALGVVLFALTVFFDVRFMPFQEALIMIIVAAGAAVAFVPRSLRSNENDLDTYVLEKCDKYDEIVVSEKNITDLITRRLKPVIVGDYVFEGENFVYRNGKDDRRYRSPIYKASALIFTEAGIYVSMKTFSLVDASEKEDVAQFVYEDMDGLSTAEGEIALPDGSKIRTCFIVFSENGKEALRIPAKRGAETDRLCDDVNHYISDVKKASRR
jgi:hypothetical protein